MKRRQTSTPGSPTCSLVTHTVSSPWVLETWEPMPPTGGNSFPMSASVPSCSRCSSTSPSSVNGCSCTTSFLQTPNPSSGHSPGAIPSVSSVTAKSSHDVDPPSSPLTLRAGSSPMDLTRSALRVFVCSCSLSLSFFCFPPKSEVRKKRSKLIHGRCD